MSKYTRKKKTPTEDEFVSFWHQAYDKLEPYLRAIGITLASAVVVWFAGYGIATYFEHRTESVTEAFSRAVRIYDADLLGDEPAPKTDEENPIPRFKTAKERADAVVAELDALDKKWGGSDVAKNALVFRAGIYYDNGRFADAQSAYQKFLSSGRHDPSLEALAQEGVGLSAEALGKLDDALNAYQALEPKTGDFYRDRALYDQARVYIKKGDKKKAASLYQQILAKQPTTPLRDEIQSQLAVLESP